MLFLFWSVFVKNLSQYTHSYLFRCLKSWYSRLLCHTSSKHLENVHINESLHCSQFSARVRTHTMQFLFKIWPKILKLSWSSYQNSSKYETFGSSKLQYDTFNVILSGMCVKYIQMKALMTSRPLRTCFHAYMSQFVNNEPRFGRKWLKIHWKWTQNRDLDIWP